MQKKLYIEWVNSDTEKEIAEIIENPISDGGFDIKNIDSFTAYFETKRDTIMCDLLFNCEYQAYKLHLDKVTEIYNNLHNITAPFTFSIENGEQGLMLLAFEKDCTVAIYTVHFESGTIKNTIPK